MLQLIMTQTQMKVIFGSNKCLTSILKGCLPARSSNLDESDAGGINIRKLVCFDKASQELQDLCQDLEVELIDFEYELSNQTTFYNSSKPNDQDYFIDHTKAKKSDIFTISYTSGTEKNSKGVIITNLNFLSAITNILKVAGEFPFNETDTYLSYLPLAHVFDRLGCYSAMSVGAGIGFFGGEILKIIDDL